VPGYRVLLTSLIGRALPLIRYESVRQRDARPRPWLRQALPPDRAGRRSQRRSAEAAEAQRRRGSRPPYRLRAPFLDLPDVVQYQVAHEHSRLAVRIVLRPDASVETVDRVRAGMKAALEAAGATPPTIVVEPVAEIEGDPGSMKVKVVKTLREAAA
jgi:hypothetical protein